MVFSVEQPVQPIHCFQVMFRGRSVCLQPCAPCQSVHRTEQFSVVRKIPDLSLKLELVSQLLPAYFGVIKKEHNGGGNVL